MGKKLTEKEYIERLNKFFPNIKLIGHYINHATKVLHRCLIHNYDWEIRPNHVLRGEGCPQCRIDKLKQSATRTHEEYVRELKNKNPNIEILDTYIKAGVKITHKCKICGHIWKVQPNSLLHGTGCPVCSGNVCGGAPKYQNSIWASEYREFFSQYLTEEQMKTFMPHSNQKIDVICPDCNKRKMIAPTTILHNYGIDCICGDGVTYPNKFVYSVLNQLGISYETEHIFNWAKDKRYDVYIPSLNCIIENHGAQHYTGGFLSMAGKTLQEEQENDAIKQNFAIQNGIKYYIVLDCRKSDIDWIKKSILHSQLNKLFDLSTIDFCKCGEYACSNLVKVVADLWNNGLSIKDIVKSVRLSATTVQHYLIRAAQCNICDWTPKASHKRGMETCSGINHPGACPVVQLSMDYQIIKIWGYVKEAEDKLNITNIFRAAYKDKTAGGYRWKHLYDRIGKDDTIIPGAITLGLITEEEALKQLTTQQNENKGEN